MKRREFVAGTGMAGILAAGVAPAVRARTLYTVIVGQ